MAVYLFLTDGFEETEALTTVDILRRAEVAVAMVSITGSRMVTSSHGIRVEADSLFDETDMREGEMLVLPGGAVLPGYRAHEGLAALIRQYAAAGTLIAAICAAPTFLAGMSLLDGRTAVCFPAMAAELVGARYGEGLVERDGQFITSKAAGTTVHFALALVEALCGKEMADRIGRAFVAQV